MYDLVVGIYYKLLISYYKTAKYPMVVEACSTRDRKLTLAIAHVIAVDRSCTCVRVNVHCVYIDYQIVVEFYL